MAATLTLDTITSSGSEIEIPTGKTLKIADAGALKINNIAITTGAQTVLSKTAAYTILPGDFTGKSSLIVFVDVSAGTSTETVITLPAAADFGTCAIHVVSTTTHGSGNYITIKNSSAVEQYSLYFKGDHCELVSDATNVFRTGNEFATIRSEIALTADVAIGAGVQIDVFNGATASNYSVTTNIGSGWNSTSHDFIAPYAGLYRFGGHGAATTGAYVTAWMLKKNSAWITLVGTGMNQTQNVLNTVEFPMDLAKDDSIEFWAVNHTGSFSVLGAAASTSERSFAAAWMLRRY